MLKFSCVITVILLINGCIYTDYAGFYHLSRDSDNFVNRPATWVELDFIIDTIKSVSGEFGFSEVTFSEGYRPTNIIVYAHNSKDTNTNYDHLKGAKSLILITMVKDLNSISIFIKDSKNTIETDFVKALKARLEKELSKEIDMKKVIFRRRALDFT